MKPAWRAYGQEPAHCSRLGLSSIRRGGALPYKEFGQHETRTRTQSPSTHTPACAASALHHLPSSSTCAARAVGPAAAAAKCCWPEHALRHLSKPRLSLSQRQGGRRKPALTVEVVTVSVGVDCIPLKLRTLQYRGVCQL